MILVSSSKHGSPASFARADLSCTNLLGAIIEGADLTGANLQGVDLSGVISVDDLVCDNGV